MGPYATDRDRLAFIVGVLLISIGICIGAGLLVVR